MGLVEASRVVPESDEPSRSRSRTDAELIAAAAPSAPAAGCRARICTAGTRIAFISIPVQVKGPASSATTWPRSTPPRLFRPVIRTHLTYAIACRLVPLAIGIVGYQVAGRLLSPLRALQTTAQRITETDLSDRIPADQLASRDEVGRPRPHDERDAGPAGERSFDHHAVARRRRTRAADPDHHRPRAPGAARPGRPGRRGRTRDLCTRRARPDAAAWSTTCDARQSRTTRLRPAGARRRSPRCSPAICDKVTAPGRPGLA